MITRKQLIEGFNNLFKEENCSYTVITNENSKEGGILLVGCNPSSKDDEKEHDYFACNDDFWKPKHEMMGLYDSLCAYIDLLPIRDGNQNRFEKQTNIDLKGRALSLTQDYIEELHPRLIISVNKSSKHYWGFDKVKIDGIKKPFVDEYDKVWMGYEFEPIKPSPLTGRQEKGYWDFYKIKGIVPSGVNKWRNKTSLVEQQESYYLQYRQHEAHGNVVKPERQLTPEDVKVLVEWIDPEWAKTLL